MTAKRDSKSKPKTDEPPKVKKETLKDLQARDAKNVKAGRAATGGASDCCNGSWSL